MRPVLFFGLMMSLLVACSKEPGEGGNASISGTVLVQARVLLNNPNTIVYEAPAPDIDVHIIYGDGPGPDDRILTNYDGEFQFNYLREGKYTIYVFSKDTTDTAVNGQSPQDMTIIREIEITDRKQELELDPIMIYDNN